MKKLNSNDNIFKKTIIASILVILCNFLVPNFCYGSTRTDVADALCDFFCALPDAGFYVLQHFFLKEGDVKIHVYSKEEETNGTPWYGKWDVFDIFWNGEFDLPNIKFTPYYIFANKIPVLNANFFGEGIDLQKKYYMFPGYYQQAAGHFQIEAFASEDKEDVVNYIKEKCKRYAIYASDEIEVREIFYDFTADCLDGKITDKEMNEIYNAWVEKKIIEPIDYNDMTYMQAIRETFESKSRDELKSFIMGVFSENTTIDESELREAYNSLDSKYKAKRELGSYEKYVDMIKLVDGEKVLDSSAVLKPIVSKWYGILRSVAIIGLLIVLVYASIKIIISSASKDKAKYKKILKDWVVAMCLVFVLHYIMSFTMGTIDALIGVLENSNIENVEEPVYSDLECKEDDPLNIAAYNKHFNKEESSSEATWTCNSIEDIRYKAEMARVSTPVRMGYIVMYMVLCFLTFSFTWQYFKRLVYMAILTLLAPIIAFTYPIDKMADGKAQGFNMWLKEYIFNALIQFVHLLLYYIIIVAAGELAQENPVYGIVALGCMKMVEKLLRKFFSVGKQSNTVGPFDGAAGAALVMSGMNMLDNFGSGGLGGADNGGEADKAPKLYTNKESFDAMEILRGDAGSGENQLLNAGTESLNTGGNADNAEDQNGNVDRAQTDNNTAEEESGEDSNVTPGGNGNNDLYSNVLNHLNNRNIEPTPRRQIKHPMLYAAGYAAKNRFRGMPGRSVRTLGRTVGHGALRIGGGLVGATIGLAAGIASGDASNAFKYTAAGAYATGKVADKIGTGIGQGIANGYSDYKQGRINIDTGYAADVRLKEFKRNAENSTYIASRYSSRAERKEVYNIAKETTKYGIDDVQDVAAIHELVKRGRSVNHAIAIAKMSKKTGDLIKKPKNRKDWTEKLVTQKQFTEQQAKTILDDIELFQGEKD